jgi:hypothetical protein
MAVYPQIYLGHTPATAHARAALRARALDLRECFGAARQPMPTYLLLNFAAGDGPDAGALDLLLVCPHSVIVGAIRAYDGPIEVLPGKGWTLGATGEPIHEPDGRTPLHLVQAQRDAVRERLNGEAPRLLGAPLDAQPFDRIIGAVICAPRMHPDSRISLDVDEHRQLLKVLGLDELPGLAAMSRTNLQLAEEQMQAIVGDIFAGRRWHDGARFLFELAPPRLRLRLLDAAPGREMVLPLLEGETVIGRRRMPLGRERRLTLSGDDLISSDHARIFCDDEDRVVLRDTSKNGTWIAMPGAPEEHVRGEERVIAPGTLLRMGMTRMRLEKIAD